jgi:hypothetical protein
VMPPGKRAAARVRPGGWLAWRAGSYPVTGEIPGRPADRSEASTACGSRIAG